MSFIFDKIAEEKIQEAIRNGEFDKLPSKGKPINLEEWASLPEDSRVGYILLRNAGYIPDEVNLLKEIGELRDQLAACPNHNEKKSIRKKLEYTKLKFNLLIDLRRKKRHKN
jgi:hypothetical protein